MPGFALETLALALRLAPSEVSVEMGSHVQLGSVLRLPIDAAGRALLDARAYGRVNRLSLDDLPLLVVGQATPEARAAAERMRGGVVIIGRTDKTSRTLRRLYGKTISEAEALAWAAASLEEAPATRRASAWWDAGIIAVWAAGGTWAAGRGRRAVFSLGGAALLIYALFALAVFAGERLWLPCALPLGLTALVITLASLVPPSRTASGVRGFSGSMSPICHDPLRRSRTGGAGPSRAEKSSPAGPGVPVFHRPRVHLPR